MDNKVLITNSNNEQITADVVTAFKLDNNQSYIVYTFNEKSNDNIKVYVSKVIEENDKIYFNSITDEEEWKQVKEAIINETIN